MTALQLGKLLNRYLTAMSHEILARRGTVDKFIGDAIMAVWGAPLDDAEHAAHAVETALRMNARLQELQDLWAAEGLPRFQIGIGINTGMVSVGNFGSDERFDYTVVGDNVNLASRLEGLTKLYGVPIIISESTRSAIGQRFVCRQIDRVRVVGREQPADIFEPLLAGDPTPELLKEVTLYEEALCHYFRREFAAAHQLFLELDSVSPQPLCQHYLKRVENFLVNPPPQDWDGITAYARK
jgi:adenylate cyclase